MRHMHDPRATRDIDEAVLHLLKERDKGVPCVALGLLIGKPSQYVSTATKRVADADMKHDPEAVGAYPWRSAVGRR